VIGIFPGCRVGSLCNVFDIDTHVLTALLKPLEKKIPKSGHGDGEDANNCDNKPGNNLV